MHKFGAISFTFIAVAAALLWNSSEKENGAPKPLEEEPKGRVNNDSFTHT